jgi:hypothetical protein
MFIGFKVAAAKLVPIVGTTTELSAAIAGARGEQKLSFAQQFGKMFSVDIPAGVDGALLAKTAELWKAYWLLPAGMAAAIAIVFLLAFRDKSADDIESKH